MKVKIEITKSDIKKGKKQQIDSCPIALAIKRKLKARNICVSDGVAFNLEGNEYWVDLPNKASYFIDNFDDGLKVKPFSFIMTADIQPADRKIEG